MENRDKRSNEIPSMEKDKTMRGYGKDPIFEQYKEYRDKKEKSINIIVNGGLIFLGFIAGLILGITLILLNNRDAIRHYNHCQEKVLIDSLAKFNDLHANCWQPFEVKNLVRSKNKFFKDK